jgi:hypothetical protein
VLLAARPADATMVSSEESKMSVLMPMRAARTAMLVVEQHLTHCLRQRPHQLPTMNPGLVHPMVVSPILLVVASSEMSCMVSVLLVSLMSEADPPVPDHHRAHRLQRSLWWWTHQPW